MERFLISRLSSLGDVVCSLPAASALKSGFPGCEVVWVVDPRFAGIVESCASVDRVVKRAKKPGDAGSAGDPALDQEFEAALDLQGLLKSAWVIAKVKAKKKVGYHWQREGAALFSQRVIPDPSSTHIVDQYVDVARAVGGKADRADFALAPSPEALDSIRAKIPGEPFLVINPGAAWVSKRYPPEQIAKVVDALPVRTVFIGAKGETGGAEAAAICRTQTVDLTGKTSIAELIALLSLAKAHVGGDTGSTHISAALGTPTIGLYSSTRPERSCPYGQISRCLYNPEGLGAIAPEDVLSRIMEAIA